MELYQHSSRFSVAECYGLCLDILPKTHGVLAGAFSEVNFRACGVGIHAWWSARIKGTGIKGVDAARPNFPDKI